MERFNVVLTGELVPGTDPGVAIDRLASLTGLERPRAEQLLRPGRPTVVKKAVSAEVAEQYRSALEGIGIVVELQQATEEAVVAPAVPPPPPSTPPPSPASASSLPPPPSPPVHLQRPQPGQSGQTAEPGRVPASHGWKWMKEAINLFLEEQLLWIGMTLALSFLFMLVSLIPLLGSLITSLIGPVFAGGMMLGAHAQQQGRPLQFSALFEGFRHNRNQLLGLGGLQLLFGFAIGLGAAVIGFLGFFPFQLAGMGDAGPTMSTPAALTVLLLVLLILGAAACAGMAFWFAPCLVAIHGRTAWESVQQSFRTSLRNWPALLVFGLVSMVGVLAVVVVFALAGLLFHFALSMHFPVLLLQLILLLLFAPTIALFTLTSYTSFRDIFQLNP